MAVTDEAIEKIKGMIVSGELQASLTALGAYGRAEDVAATVAHLAGDGGRYITGASIAVDGGFAV